MHDGPDRRITKLPEIQALRSLLDSIPQPILVKDENSRFVILNLAMCRLMGRPYGELIGKQDHEFVTPEQAELYRAADLEVLTTGQSSESEEPFRDADGVSRTILTRKNRLVLEDGSKLIIGSITDITEFRRIEALIRYQATHDALTELANRRVFTDQVASALTEGGEFAVHCIDLDYFKGINDTLGHGVGDRVLKIAGERLRDCCDSSDIVARVGGDEFAILQRHLRKLDDARFCAAQIVSTMAGPIEIEDHRIQIGASIGVAVAPGDGQEPETLTRKADVALYEAKAKGRSTYSFYSAIMDQARQAKTLVQSTIRHALDRQEFYLEYQPLVRLADTKICGVEALLRWNHPKLGVLSPAEFLQLAEETRAIDPIGAWVLQEACKRALAWPSHIRISVNLSPVQFETGNLVATVMSALTLAGLPNDRLELEVTEMTLLKDNAAVVRQLQELKALGISIAMDDFGTGFSSLSYLQAFPFDTIKIDKGFVQAIGVSKESRAIIAAVSGLGRSLGIRTIAEGVESEEQLDFVREHGCAEAQGYLFSPPMPAALIGDLIIALEPRLRTQRDREKVRCGAGQG